MGYTITFLRRTANYFQPAVASHLSVVPIRATVGQNKTGAYVHVRGGGGCDYWVPEGKDLIWAMQELVRAYRWINLPPRNDEAID
jgi:hypothetical protein